jgi:hypothetical protein
MVTKKKMRSLIHDEKAASNALEFAILISTTVSLMVIVIVLFQGLVADAATLSLRTEYTSLGNQLSTAINDMYLSNCTDASRTFTIPYRTPNYGISFASDYLNRPAIKIHSTEVTVFVPVNIEGRGDSTINVAGNASSITSTKVRITKCGNNITLVNV